MGNHCCSDKSVAVSVPAPRYANVLSDPSAKRQTSPVPTRRKNPLGSATPVDEGQAETPSKHGPGSRKLVQPNSPHLLGPPLAALQKEEEAERALLVSEEARCRADIVSDGADSLERSATAPPSTFEPLQAELAKGTADQAQLEPPNRQEPGPPQMVQPSVSPTPTATLATALAALQKEEEAARALLVSAEVRQRASVVHDGADSLEWIAIALTNTFEPFQAELNQRAADTRIFARKLGYVHEEFFRTFYNIYTLLAHAGNSLLLSNHFFLLGTGTMNAQHVDYILVRDADVARMIEHSSPALKHRWADRTKTPLSVAKMLNELHMRAVWHAKTVDFWEGLPPTPAMQRYIPSRAVPLLELPMSEVTLLNCKISKSLAYPSKEQRKYMTEEVPVHALVFVSSGGQLKGCRGDIRFLRCDVLDLAQAADCLPKDTMLVIYPCRASVFAEHQLADRVKTLSLWKQPAGPHWHARRTRW